MKKKILLVALMVALLVCLFAISTSAVRVEDYDAEYTLKTTESFVVYYSNLNFQKSSTAEDGTVTVTDHKENASRTNTVSVTYLDEKGDVITKVPLWEYDAEDGKYYSLVWYISAYEYTYEEKTLVATTRYSGVQTDVSGATMRDYTSAIYTLSKVRAVDLRYKTSNVTKSVSSVPSWTTSRTMVGVKGIYLTNATDDTADDIKLQDTVGIGRDVSDYGYKGWEAQFAASGDKIVVGNFRDCTFEADVEGNYGTSNTWSSAYHIQCLWYPDTMKYINGGIGSLHEVDLGDGIEIIACQILRDNKNVKEFIIPNSVLYLNNEAFRGTDLTTLVIGENLIVHGGSPFLYTGVSDYVYISKNSLTTLTSNITAMTGTSITIYFDGNLEQAETLMADMIAEKSDYKGKITLVDYNTTTERGDVKNVCLFYNYNRCEAFYRNQHQDNGNDCVTYCKRCELLAQKAEEDKIHNYITDSIVYNDLSVVGVKTYHCQNEHCTHSTAQTLEAKAIFVYVGFSTDKNTASRFCVGYQINQDALKAYKEVNQTEVIGYGLVAVATDNTKAPIGADGNRVSDKIVQAKLSTLENADTILAVDLIIKGDFTNATNANANLGMALYTTKTTIVEGETKTEVSYIGSTGSTTEIETVTFATQFPELAPQE